MCRIFHFIFIDIIKWFDVLNGPHILDIKRFLKNAYRKKSLRAIQWWAHEMYLSHYPNMWPLILIFDF
jgi:tRNA (Thr-GGU) A37 N-methylase